MSGKNTKGSRAAKSASRLQDTFSLSLADIEALTRHPQIKIADRRLRKALQAITGWKMTAKGGIPRRMFTLAAAYEDALGQVKEAFILATRDWVLSRTCPLCGSRRKRTTQGTH